MSSRSVFYCCRRSVLDASPLHRGGLVCYSQTRKTMEATDVKILRGVF